MITRTFIALERLLKGVTDMEKSQLVELIVDNSNKYYTGQTCVANEVWDQWLEELRIIDPDNELFRTVGWGYSIEQDNLLRFPHLTYFTGISNKPRVSKDQILPSGSIKTPKMDGGSVELQYINGRFMRALTRGDGYNGLDCTSKLRYTQGIVIEMPEKYTGSIIGEYVISDEDLNVEDPIGQRNIPNGFLSRGYAPSEDECRKFSFVAYKIGTTSTHRFSSRVGILEFLNRMGFLTVSYIKGSIEYAEAITRLRLIGGKHYLLDGIVSDSNEIVMHDSGTIGYIDEFAYKTVSDTKDTPVKRIDWNLTRTGKLIPTLVLEPVILSGAHIDRVLAHNAKNVLESGIGIGAVIEVVRSGEVIPYIYGITSPSEVELPTHCPACGAELKWDGVHLMCKNPDCSGQNYANLYHWISNIGGVDNLGGSLINAIIEGLEIEEIADFYKDYDLNRLIQRDGIGQSKISIVDSSLKKLRSPHRFEEYLVASNIRGLSWETAFKLTAGTSIRTEIAKEFFSSEFEDQLMALRGVSYSTKINLLKSWGKLVDTYQFMVIDDTEPAIPENTAERIKVCITGKLEFGTKSKFYQEYADQIVEADVKNCDYLIANEDKGSAKYKQAEKLQKHIVTESEFLQIIRKE